MEKGTIVLEPFWGRQSLKPQRALLLSSTWSTPPGRCSQARWGWCGWRWGRGPGGTGRGPAPDSASSEDTHHSSVITEIEVSPTLAAVSRAQEGEECGVRASQSGHNLYLLEVWGVSVWDECLLAWPHSPGLRVWARAGHWLVTGPASDRPAAHCQGRASQIQTGQICSGGNCWLQCWLSLAGSGVRIPNYNWRCLCVSRVNQTTSAISWFSFWMSIKYNAPWFLWSMLNVLNVFDWKLPSENIRITYFPVFVNISNGSGAWLQCVERV